jgi:energy-coupling factor transporter ATP-binding protein EcfA2
LIKLLQDNEHFAVFKNVSYQYPRSNHFALTNINLEVKKGEILGLIGATGAGKTTICLAFNGIVPQFYKGRFFGSVSVAGLDTINHSINELAHHVGLVFEDPETQLITTSVENEVAFALENLKIPRETIIERIKTALAMVRLDGFEKKHPHELSGGQKQRLAIASALAIQPELLILDEPTSQLDPAGADEVFSTIHNLNSQLGTTIVIASHSVEEMAEYADRIVLLAEGEVAAIGTPDEIFSNVNLLNKNNLRPPQVTNTFYKIQKHGIRISKLPVRMQDATPMLVDFTKFPITETAYHQPPTKNNNNSIYSIHSLSHTYPNGVRALSDITLDIKSGEYILIIGQNGAGKSTLVKHLVNLLKPTSGSIKFKGTPLKNINISEISQQVGYVSQNPDNQIFNPTVIDEINFSLKNLKYDPEEINTRTIESLESLNLTQVKDHHPLSLPKGERAQVVIGAVLAMKPDVFIFDEPTTGQDYKNAIKILDITKELHKSKKTIIVITHHLYLMPNYAQRVIVMGKGTILLDADIRTAFHQTEILNTTFLSPPQAVLISKELQKSNPKFQSFLTPEEIANFIDKNRGNS